MFVPLLCELEGWKRVYGTGRSVSCSQGCWTT